MALTKDWLMILLRRKPDHQGLHVNSLGYLGLLYADSQEKKRIIDEMRPLALLKEMAVPVQAKVND